MQFEVLFETTFEENYGDWAKCEGSWQDRTNDEIEEILRITCNALKFTNDERPWLEWGSKPFTDVFSMGHAVSVPYMFIRIKSDKPKCPKCGSSILGHGALSRRDNKTYVCSDCGTKEAFEDYYDVREDF